MGRGMNPLIIDLYVAENCNASCLSRNVYYPSLGRVSVIIGAFRDLP
jgi:hypothetical protein